MNFSLNIKSYGLTALSSVDAQSTSFSALKYQYPATPNIPMMQSRRMSIATKLASELYLNIAKETSFDYAIFLSAHGEIERSFKILQQILQDKLISPTDFSMSVHNVTSGITGIMNKNNCETTSIAASFDGFITVFYEILSALQQGKKRILLIANDGEMPEFYQSYGATKNSAYAVALIIEQGDEWQGSITANSHISNDDTSPKKIPLPLQFWSQWQQTENNKIVLVGTDNTLSLSREQKS